MSSAKDRFITGFSCTVLIVLGLLAIAPAAFWYFGGLPHAAWWCWAWLLLFVVFLFLKIGAFEKGLIFAAGSVLIAVAGQHLAREAGQTAPVVLDMLFQTMLLVGGGIGGNFMAHALITGDYAKKR